MKTWKEVPQLFFNGNFQLKLPDGGVVWIETLNVPDITYDQLMDCTLIARKIEDIKQIEWELMYKKFGYLNLMRMWREGGELSFGVIMHLLSIGVYPFPWDETVIDIKTIGE